MLQLDSDIHPSLDGEIECLLDTLTERHVRDIAARLAQDARRCDYPASVEGEPGPMLHIEAGRWAPSTVR